MISKKSTTYIVLVLLLPFLSVAQTGSHPSGVPLTGKVIDGTTKQPIHAATIALLRKDSSVAAEVISQPDGDFTLKNLPEAPCILQISVVGYQTVTRAIPAGHRTAGVPFNTGTIRLTPFATQMQSVAVVARRPVFRTEIDKKVFNVDQSLASKGGTAQDALRQVPTLNVDATGNVTLRNGSPTILLDGKQTQLTLDQIPADQIQSIEVMPNPSAKYDAQGNHGIINIVLKRNRKPGMNGSFTGVGSTLGETYGFANLNVYKHKWNFTFNAMAHGHRSISNSTTTLTDLATNTTSVQRGHSVTIGPFQSYRLGADYNMDAHNTFSLSGNLGFGYHPSGGNQATGYFDKGGQLDSLSSRRTYDANHFVFSHSNFDYAHTFDKSGEKLTASAALETYHGTGHGNYSQQYLDTHGAALSDLYPQRYQGFGNAHNLTLQSDYSDPLLDGKAKLEAGVKTILHGSRSYEDFENGLPQGGFDKNVSASYNYSYNDNTYAAYSSFNQELGKFSYMAGLRFERYNYMGHLLDENSSFGYHQTGLYPSVYLTEKFDEDNDLHLNFSRRVNRPQWWQITPQTNYGNPLNPSQGNPQIRPENTNLVELAYNTQVSGIGFNTTLYLKNTLDPIMGYNKPLSADTLLSTFENGNYSNTYGAEIIARIPIAKWWNATTNFNVFESDINADNLSQGQGLSNSGISWFAKLNSDMKLFNTYSVQLTGNYNAARVIAQGRVLPSGGLDAAIKRDFLPHNAATLVLSLSDIFNTQRTDIDTYSQGVFFQNAINKPETRVFKISFMYSFGKELNGDRHKATLESNG